MQSTGIRFCLLSLLLLFGTGLNLLWAQDPENSEYSGEVPVQTAPAVPEEYAWYQYAPGDTSQPDTSKPMLPVWSFGLRAGNAGYIGEINQQKMNPFSGGFTPGFGLMATRHLSRMFETSLEFHYLSFSGNDGIRRFKSKATEFTGNITLNITQSFQTEKAKARKLQFYAFFGTGFHFYSAEMNTDSSQSKTGKTSELVLATGLSAGYRFHPKLEAGAVFSYRYVNTDLLDATPNPYSGNDSYTLLGLSIRYLISKPDKKETDIVARLKKEMLEYMTLDTDGDGVADYLDQDHTTPAGTVVDARGIPLDTDGDGIPDAQDGDPFTPEGLPVDEKGIPSDRDGDGVPDYRDAEPDAGGDQIVNYQGKVIQVQKNEIRKETSAPETDLIRRVISTWNLSLIRFAPGSTLVAEKYYQGLSELAFLMQSQPDIDARIIGHTDAQGKPEQNTRLAKARAEEVARILKEVYSISGSRIHTEAAAAENPMTNPDAPQNISGINRRVEIRLKFRGTEIR